MTKLRTLLVCSPGGHLGELDALAPRIEPPSEQTWWATASTPQSDQLLAGRRHLPIRNVPPRAWRGAVRSLPEARTLIRTHGIGRIVSTGAAVAIPYFVAGRAVGAECHYIESAARVRGMSVTGRLADLIPGVHCYTQYPAQATGKVTYAGSVFDRFSPVDAVADVPKKVVVTLGTMRFPFRRAVVSVHRLLTELGVRPSDVLWQVGPTPTDDLGIVAGDLIPPDTLRQAMVEADLVIAHAGVGSTLMALETGNRPILLPRLHQFGEHVDDHQTLICDEMERRGLATRHNPDDLTAADLIAAVGRRATSNANPPAIRLIAG
ncbi:glycosyltransferase [Nigerium massiliense]|uniref:glycosyltransferase n=1 Tax=Nigerium massiliense TaxID=1522317 RepID=UPI000694C413|nr:glycosyltransferase [Nigerium massiliense]